jgi:hypothetical protein
MQLVQHLTLRLVDDTKRPGTNVICLTEDSSSLRMILVIVSIVVSELSSVATAVLAGAAFRCWWLIGFMCIPLILKLIALFVSVRRDGLQSHDQLANKGSLVDIAVFEVRDPNHGFVLIEGFTPVIQQFFRHYGHPKRDSRATFVPDRAREVSCILLIYAFVLYFPAGLIAVIWMEPNVQYLWLSYQLYAILAMHIVRILGWQGCGRTEEHIARLLRTNHEVWLQGSGGCTIAATLITTGIPHMAEGERIVQEIINHQ